MKGRFSFFSKARIAMFSIRSYPIFIRDKFNKVLGYALILSLLVGSVFGVSQFALFSLLEDGAQKIIQDDTFRFKLENGVLDFENSPYQLEESNSIVIIDTDKSLMDEESLRSIIVHKDMAVVILNDGIIARTYGEEYVMKYNDIPLLPQYINNEIISGLISDMSPVKYILFIASVLITYIKLLVYAVIVSLVGLIVSKIQRIGIGYINILKLSIYSLTSPMVVQLMFPIGSLMLVISSFYVILSISYVRSEIIELPK